MFESLHALIPKIKSWQIQSQINVDFGSKGFGERKSSFLPNYWSDERVSTLFDKTRSSTNVYQGAAVFRRTSTDTDEQISVTTYCTGSQYYGDFNGLGMSGKGTYKFPHGVIYDGYFNKNGEFHGSGIMIYPSGQKVEGIWRNGKLATEPQCYSQDGAMLGTPYCTMPDRRFHLEIQEGMMPAGHEYLTNDPVPRPIPLGMYDTCEGYFDPAHHIIIDYIDLNKSKNLTEVFDTMTFSSTNQEQTLKWLDMVEKLRARPSEATTKIDPLSASPLPELERWIKKYCRKEWDEPTGYIEQMYEVWTAGYRREDCDNISKLPSRTEEEEEVIKGLSQITKPKVDPKMNKFINKTSVIYTEEKRRSINVHLVNPKPELLTAKKKSHKKLKKRMLSQLSSVSQLSSIRRKE